MPPSADDYDGHDQDRPRQHHHHRSSPRAAAPPPAKFDLRLNPPYQIDFANVAAGKTIAATKRRVRFRFGFSNRQALEEGQVGVDCRGEEHEVVVVISALSGKRQVYADGHEVHFSYGSRTDSTFETAWTMKGGHLVKIRGHVALPLFETPGFRQFDLTIDGLSYFAMPKLYELGIKKTGGQGAATATAPRSVSPPGRDDHEYEASSYEGGYSRRRSTPDDRPARKEEPASSSVVSMEEPVDILSDASMALSSSDLLSSATSASPSMLLDSAPFSASKDEFAPVEAPPAAAPTNDFASLSNSILSRYGPAATSASASPYPQPQPSGVLALANESHTHYTPAAAAGPGFYSPQQPSSYAAPPVTPSHSVPSPHSHYGGGGSQAAPATAYYNYNAPAPQYSPYAQQPPPSTTSPYYAPVSPEGSIRSVTTAMEDGSASGGSSFDPSPVKLTMQPLTLEDVDEVLMQEEGARRPMTDVERAMASLVNLGDIQENKVTPEQRRAMQAKEQKLQAKKKSQPAPPAAPSWRMGTDATLADLKQTPKDDKKNSSTGPKKEIMRTHAFDPRAVHAGMMVVYGTDPSGGGIPPSQGFGVGAVAAAVPSGPGYAPNPYHQQYPYQPQQPYVAPAQAGY